MIRDNLKSSPRVWGHRVWCEDDLGDDRDDMEMIEMIWNHPQGSGDDMGTTSEMLSPWSLARDSSCVILRSSSGHPQVILIAKFFTIALLKSSNHNLSTEYSSEVTTSAPVCDLLSLVALGYLCWVWLSKPSIMGRLHSTWPKIGPCSVLYSDLLVLDRHNGAQLT